MVKARKFIHGKHKNKAKQNLRGIKGNFLNLTRIQNPRAAAYLSFSL